MSGTRTAILHVSAELLRECLRLPQGTLIDAAQFSFERPDILELRVTHEALAEIPAGGILPLVTASFRSEEVEATSKSEIHFVGWVE